MSDDVKTGEQHAGKVQEVQKVQPSKTAAPKNNSVSPLVAAVAGGALLIIGFFGGAVYQKNHTATAQMPGGGMILRGDGPIGGMFGGPNGGPGERRFNTKRLGGVGIGTVKTVSNTSITVTDLKSGSEKTFTINGDTKVYKVTQTASINDVKTGNWVLVTPSSTDENVAAQIHYSTEIPGLGGPTTAN